MPDGVDPSGGAGTPVPQAVPQPIPQAAPAPQPPVVQLLNALTPDALKGLRGSHAIEGASFQGTYLAYQQARAAAKAIAKRVAEKGTKSLLIAEDGVEDDLIEFQELDARIAQAKRVADAIAKEVDPLVDDVVVSYLPLPVGAVVSAGLAVASLFSRQRSDTHFPVEIDDATLILLLRAALKGKVAAPTPAELARAGAAALREEPPRGGLAAAINQLQLVGDGLRSRLAKVEARLPVPKGMPVAGGGQTSQADPNAPALASLKPRLDAAIKAVEAIDAGLWSRLRHLSRGAEALNRLGKEAHVLEVRVLAGGGGTHTEDSPLWRDVIEHSGGVIVSYALYASDGSLVEADLVRRHKRAIEDGPPTEPWVDET